MTTDAIRMARYRAETELEEAEEEFVAAHKRVKEREAALVAPQEASDRTALRDALPLSMKNGY